MKKILFLIFFITSLFSQNLQKTSIQLMWLDQFQFAGFYMAKEQGFYENVGLDVEIKKFNSNINITDEVLNKRADFGVNSTSLFVDKSQNKNIVLLGAIFQTSPLMVLALQNSSIDSVQDFKNKKLMITQEQLGFATFKAMLSSNGVNISDMKILPHSYNVDDLIDKKTDLMLSYTTNEPFLLKEKSYESRIFHPKDYGFNFYEELLFTSEELANSKPKLVNDFYKASILGWIWAFNNIDESVDIIYNKYNSQNKSKEALLFEANEMKKLVLDEFGNIGTLNKDKLNLIINTYKVMGLIKNDINLEDFVFNNAILDIRLNSEEQNYLKQKKSITYCSHSDLMPFEAILDNKHIGFTEDYINYISKTLGVEFEFIPTSHWSESLKKTIENSCDILTTIASKKDREELLNFTKPIIEFPFVLVTDTVKPFIENINNPSGSRHVPEKHDALVKYAQKQSPFNNMTIAYKKEHIVNVGGYQHHLWMEDYNLFLRLIAANYKLHNLNDILVYARVDNGMHGRRKGLAYIKSEFQLMKTKINLQLQNPLQAFIIFFLRSSVRLLPSKMLASIYNVFLRKKVTK